MDAEKIKTLIENGIDNAEVRIFTDDNTHFAALVVASAFAGKRSIARHQQVYACLGSLMGNEIHAMSIRAYTPEEWAKAQDEARS